MKVAAISLIGAAAAVNDIDTLTVVTRHGARTHLEKWFADEDYHFNVPMGELTSSGYSQAIQLGSRYYYKYKHIFGNRTFLKDKYMTATSSDIARCVDTATGFMRGWNLIAEHDEVLHDAETHHFGDGSLAPFVNPADQPLKDSVVMWPEILRGTDPRIQKYSAVMKRHKNVTDFHKKHRAFIESDIIPLSNFYNSTKCPSAAPCTAEDFNLQALGSFASTFVSHTLHGMATTLLPATHKEATPEQQAFLNLVLKTGLAVAFPGRGADVILAGIVDKTVSNLLQQRYEEVTAFNQARTQYAQDVGKYTHMLEVRKKQQEGKTRPSTFTPRLKVPTAPRYAPQPGLNLMGTHDSTLTALFDALGLPFNQIPDLFYADGVAIEVKLGRGGKRPHHPRKGKHESHISGQFDSEDDTPRDEPAPVPQAAQELDEGRAIAGGCIRFLFNGISPLAAPRFPSCPHARELGLKGQGWTSLDAVWGFARSTLDHPEEDPNPEELLDMEDTLHGSTYAAAMKELEEKLRG